MLEMCPHWTLRLLTTPLKQRDLSSEPPNTTNMKSMKKTLLTALLSCLAIASVRADQIWTDTFTYADGEVTNTSGLIWTRTSGTGKDAYVKNGRLENAATGGIPVSRQDDIQRRVAATAGSPYTNGQQVLYTSYILNCTNFPNAASTYFT